MNRNCPNDGRETETSSFSCSFLGHRPAPHRNFTESAVADRWTAYCYMCVTGHGQDAKVTQRSPGPETLPCMSLQIDMLSNKLRIFQFFLHISQMWETLGDHEFLVLQCPPIIHIVFSLTVQAAWWFDVICVRVWHSEWSWDVVSTCVDFSFEGLAPLWRTCMNASSSRSLQSVLVLLVAQRYRKFDVWSLYGLTTWQQKWNPYDLRIIPYHLQVTSFLSRSKWVEGSCTETHKVPRECHVSISPLELYRKRNWLNRQSSRAQSGTQLLQTKRLQRISWYWTT